jgi:hypothetical protein
MSPRDRNQRIERKGETIMKVVKRGNMKLLAGALAVGLIALIGLPTAHFAAQPDGQSWSMVVHLAYQDGTEYDYVFATGVPTQQIPSYLAECGKGHWHHSGAVVQFHCYPIPE